MSERAAYWQRLLGEWEQSGLSQAEFCRRRGVKAVNLAWWTRRLRGSADTPSAGRQRATRRAGVAVNPPSWSRWVGWLATDQTHEALPPHKTAERISA
jgi:hypothetical protein